MRSAGDHARQRRGYRLGGCCGSQGLMSDYLAADGQAPRAVLGRIAKALDARVAGGRSGVGLGLLETAAHQRPGFFGTLMDLGRFYMMPAG